MLYSSCDIIVYIIFSTGVVVGDGGEEQQRPALAACVIITGSHLKVI